MGTIPKPEHGSFEWLQLRHRDETGWPRVSASDAASIHAEHRFKTKHALAAEKLAAEPEVTETNRAMERGQRLEHAIIEWLSADVGQDIHEPDVMYVRDSMISTLDGYIGDDVENPDTVVEIKTFNGNFDPDNDYGEGYGPLPAYWYWQGVQQATTTGAGTVLWGVLDSTLDLKHYWQTVTDEEKQRHHEAVEDFCKHIAAGIIPDEWEHTYDDLMKSQPVLDDVRDITEHASLIGQLKEVKAEMRELALQEDEIKASLAFALDGAIVGSVNGVEVVTWKQQSRNSFDAKRFASEHPDLHKQYTTSSTFRVLRTKEVK